MASQHTSTRCYKPPNSELTLVSANVRGLHTKVGELTHNVIAMHWADIVFVCETFLDDKVPQKYALMRGYSAWLRKDRSTQCGHVEFCYKDTVNVQVVESPVPVPRELELLTMKITDSDVLSVGCYRLPS